MARLKPFAWLVVISDVHLIACLVVANITGLHQVVEHNCHGFDLVALRRESESDRDSTTLNELRLNDANTMFSFESHDGAVRRVADTPEKRLKILDQLAKRTPNVNHFSGATVPAGWSTIDFTIAYVPRPFDFGCCPQTALLAALLGYLNKVELLWWQVAMTSFYARFPSLPHAVPSVPSTWWDIHTMSMFAQHISKHAGFNVRLTKQSAMWNRCIASGSKHARLLASNEVLLIRVTMLDDNHWVLYDGARRVVYMLDEHATVVLISQTDLATEAAASNVFQYELQVDAINMLYTLSVEK